MSAKDGLKEEYCKIFHSQKATEDELPAEKPVSIDIDDNEKKTISVYRDQ